MSSRLETKATMLAAVALLSFGSSMAQPSQTANAKNQADVDAVKLSKDDNQSQTKPAKNTHKQGAPLPFEGPPAKSGTNAGSSSTTSADKKP